MVNSLTLEMQMTPEEVYIQVMLDGESPPSCLQIIMEIFDLDLESAKSVTDLATNKWLTPYSILVDQGEDTIEVTKKILSYNLHLLMKVKLLGKLFGLSIEDTKRLINLAM